ncbi:Clp1/GlmU family protein [Desulforhopalus singaporensis]|uniref:Ribonuclease BN, tRNA processing enzyme n=1 Tax=Desulforhopalus singaporensis TaxID=91360 RepID=A0A1H0TRG6_9BACT|nr:Clp1/GlmU family protein [Desulforhopalus singaporensis]SDP56627.1 Ribonuclease BN, tRNA processing enzyme [Desulforhopalus singaporensis]
MQTPLLERTGYDDIVTLIGHVKRYRRIFFWGETGTGKSTLAVTLLHRLVRQGNNWLLLTLDPGSPFFGPPGAICIAASKADQIVGKAMFPICTLNSGRFRLPLIQAAKKLLDNAVKRYGNANFLIDSPGLVRGVGGAELVTAFVQALEIDAILALYTGTQIPFSDELGALFVPVLPVAPSSHAGRVAPAEKTADRTRRWNDFLAGASPESFDISTLFHIGTPPPLAMPQAWKGRQFGLLDGRGDGVGMGEVLALVGYQLTTQLIRTAKAEPATLVIRDACRSAQGYLKTITFQKTTGAHSRIPAELHGSAPSEKRHTPPVSCQVGAALATLVGGVFGDPLVHVRLRNRKRSFLFDLGNPTRLPAKIAHQVQAVFLSHAHLDHIGGFPWFLRSRIGPFGPCLIFGPEDTIERIENFLQAIAWDRIENLGPVFEVAEINGTRLTRARLQPGREKVLLPTRIIEDSIIFADDDLTVKAEICDHNIASVAYALTLKPAVNIRRDKLKEYGLTPGPWLATLKQSLMLQQPELLASVPDQSGLAPKKIAAELATIRPGKTLVYVADMADTPANRYKVTSLARGAHTLFCETAFAAGDRDRAKATQHLTTTAAAQIATEAAVRNLVPFHFSKRYERNPKLLYEELREDSKGVTVVDCNLYSA